MSNKAKIVWLRILHSVICLIIALFGPFIILDLIYTLNPAPHSGSVGGHYIPNELVYFLFTYAVYLLCCFVALIFFHCLNKKPTISFVITMLVASAIPLIAILLQRIDPDRFLYELSKSFAAMVPLYWLISWAFEKWINKLKN